MRIFYRMLILALVLVITTPVFAADSFMVIVEHDEAEGQSVTEDSDPLTNWLPNGPIDLDKLVLVPIDNLWGPLMNALYGRERPTNELPDMKFLGNGGDTSSNPDAPDLPDGDPTEPSETP